MPKDVQKRGLSAGEWTSIWGILQELTRDRVNSTPLILKARTLIDAACVRNYDRGQNTAYVRGRRNVKRGNNERYKARKRLKAQQEKENGASSEAGSFTATPTSTSDGGQGQGG